MTIEPGGRVVPAGELPAIASAGARSADPRAPDGSDLQILSTEHWSLLATRSLTWNESFSRAQMFLSVLSASVVALALVAQATDFGAGFIAFALVILPVVLFLGVATFVRLVAANVDETRWVVGMNRIRGAYVEIAPHLARYLVTGHHDDARGLMVTGGWADAPRLGGFVTTPAIVGVISSVVAGALVFLAGMEVGSDVPIGLALAALVFAAGTLAANRYEARHLANATTRLAPINPSPR